MALVTFDPDAKAMYISLNEGKAIVAKTIPLGEGKYLDVTDANEPVVFLVRKQVQKLVDLVLLSAPSKIIKTC